MLIFRLKELFKSEKWLNYLVTFFLENAKKFGHIKFCEQNTAKIWVGWTTLNENKERERGCLRFNQTSELAQTA